MAPWVELFSDGVGILSFGVMAFIVPIALFFIVFCMARSADPKA